MKNVLIALGVILGVGLIYGVFSMNKQPALQPVMPGAEDVAPQAGELDGTSWLASTIGKMSVTDSGITAQFEAGTLSGSDGCNRYSTSYTTEGTSITISPQIAGTQMACEEAVMNLATEYTSILPKAATFIIDGSTLFFKDATGATILAYGTDAQTLSDSSWNVTGLNNGKEAVTGLVTGTTITLNFVGDTEVSGNTGCNSYSGTYAVEGQNLSIGEIASTLMACIEPEGVSEQETQFLAALQQASVFAIENGMLVIRDSSGAMQVTAARK